MKTGGSGDISQHMALNRGEWSALCFSHFTPSIKWIGQWVKPRGSLKAVDKREVSATHQSLHL